MERELAKKFLPIAASFRRTLLLNSSPKTFRTSAFTLTKPKSLKGKSASSQKWISRHLNDTYVAQARKLGYRARSAFKLIEIDDKFKILKPGQWLIDCGASPGAWSQVAAQRINVKGQDPTEPTGRLAAVDLLDIEPIDGVITLPRSDFTSFETQKTLLSHFHEFKGHFDAVQDTRADSKDVFDGILSDMAPNATGDSSTDHYRIINLVNSAIDFAEKYCKPDSFLVAKFWNGAEDQAVVARLKSLYSHVKVHKPDASRSESAETFVLAKCKKS